MSEGKRWFWVNGAVTVTATTAVLAESAEEALKEARRRNLSIWRNVGEPEPEEWVDQGFVTDDVDSDWRREDMEAVAMNKAEARQFTEAFAEDLEDDEGED